VDATIAPNLTILPISDFRMNPFEETGNYTIHARFGQPDLIFSLIVF
jgi:hypothetical protein